LFALHNGTVTLDTVFCGFRLKPIDIKFMKAIHHKVNIVPVIAKADMLTPAELTKLKKKVKIYLIYCNKSSSGINNTVVIKCH